MSYKFTAIPIDLQAQALIGLASKEAGRRAEEDYDTHAWRRIQESKIISPIEQILFAALSLVTEICGTWKAHRQSILVDGKQCPLGVAVDMQVEIDKYRVDFLVTYHEYPKSLPQAINSVVVECDSQQWHERTEQERRYEKARDRYLTKAGYKVFHFTGTEIMADPISVSIDILAFVEGVSMEEFRETYDGCIEELQP